MLLLRQEYYSLKSANSFFIRISSFKEDFFINRQFPSFPSDAELLQRIRNGEEGAVNILLRKYLSHCRKIAQEYYAQCGVCGFNFDDLYSIACESLMDSISRFDLSKENFYSYWKICAINDNRNFLKKNFRKAMQNRYSLDFSYRDGNSLHDIFGKDDPKDQKDSLIETFERIINDSRYTFSELQKNIIKCTLSGFDINEICEILHKSRSTIYRHYNLAVAKIRRIMNNDK